jgi:hypothetical protein
MNVKARILGAAMGALGMIGVSGAALADSVTPPGERAGLDLATPLPEGVYFVNLGSAGNWRHAEGTSTFDYEIPIISWSTPWNILGAHLQFYAAAPMASLAAANLLPGHSAVARGIYDPFLGAMLAYNFGNGFSASYLAGVYIGVTGSNVTINGAGFPPLANPWDQTTFQQQLALAYHGNGWNATANLYYSIVGNSGTCCAITNNSEGVFVNFFNADMALTHTFGKWEIGMVAYGSTDTAAPFAGYQLKSQFALGGLVGYNFGPVITQFYVASDVYKRNYESYETRFLSRVIVPLWHPEAPKVVEAKY